MSDHFSLRLQARTTSRLAHRARAAGIKQRPLASRYIEEGLRHDEHPLIHFSDGTSGRRAVLLGTQLDVWEVVATVRDNDNDLAQTADYLGIPLSLTEAAFTYYAMFSDEIDEEIAANELESQRAMAAWQAAKDQLAG